MAKTEAPPLLRTSERSDFTSCQWLWFKSWVEGWAPAENPTWAWFGTAIHKGLEARYPLGRKRGSRADMIDAFVESLDREMRRVYTEGRKTPEDSEVVDAEELGKAMLLGYVARWGRDTEWEVVGTEQTFQIDVPDWRRTDRVLVTFCGTWDLVIWNRRRKVFELVDHKTRKTFPSDWSFYDLNKQAGGYLWVAPEILRDQGILGEDDYIDSIIFNCLKKQLPDPRPRDSKGRALNKDGSVSKRQPPELFYRYTSFREPEEAVRQARHVEAEARQMNLIRAGKLEPTKAHKEDCLRCKLFDVCQLDEKDPEEAEIVLHDRMKRRDPYADHREAMSEGGVHL